MCCGGLGPTSPSALRKLLGLFPAHTAVTPDHPPHPPQPHSRTPCPTPRRARHQDLWGGALPPGVSPDTTLLITDIQGSTGLWEALEPGVMDAALAQHDAALRSAAARHRGYESMTEGDSFTLAFHTPGDALLFAVEVQEALLGLAWPEELLAQPACEPVYVAAPATGGGRQNRLGRGGGSGQFLLGVPSGAPSTGRPASFTVPHSIRRAQSVESSALSTCAGTGAGTGAGLPPLQPTSALHPAVQPRLHSYTGPAGLLWGGRPSGVLSGASGTVSFSHGGGDGAAGAQPPVSSLGPSNSRASEAGASSRRGAATRGWLASVWCRLCWGRWQVAGEEDGDQFAPVSEVRSAGSCGIMRSHGSMFLMQLLEHSQPSRGEQGQGALKHADGSGVWGGHRSSLPSQLNAPGTILEEGGAHREKGCQVIDQIEAAFGLAGCGLTSNVGTGAQGLRKESQEDMSGLGTGLGGNTTVRNKGGLWHLPSSGLNMAGRQGAGQLLVWRGLRCGSGAE